MLFSNSRTSFENSIVLQTSQGSQLPQCQSTNRLLLLSSITNYVLVQHIKYLSKKNKEEVRVFISEISHGFPFKVRKKMSVCYISTDSRLWGCGLQHCPLLSSFFLGCFCTTVL